MTKPFSSATFLACCVLSSVCLAQPMEGFVKLDASKPALLFTLREMAAGEALQIQSPDANGDPVCCLAATVVKKVAVPDADAFSDDASDKPVLAYQLNVKGKPGADSFIGMAVLGPGLRPKAHGPNLHVMEGNTRNLMMTCFSNEGLHLFRSNGKAMLGHLYFSLGYDVEPTCPDAIFGR